MDINLACVDCIHFDKDLKCKAFPNGIPDDILNGLDPHTDRREDQDNDIVYEKVK